MTLSAHTANYSHNKSPNGLVAQMYEDQLLTHILTVTRTLLRNPRVRGEVEELHLK